ncbi:TPA: hypothetical protein ACH3X2_14286 [Trebouxia sp. C0005]
MPELRFGIDRRDRRRQKITSQNSEHRYQLHENDLVPREFTNHIRWELQDLCDTAASPVSIRQGMFAKSVTFTSKEHGKLTTLRKKFLEVDVTMQWRGKSYRWVSGASTFSGKRLQIMLDDETTGQELACLEGPRSLLHKTEPDTLVIRGNEQELGDPEWVRLVVGSALVKAWQCRRNNQDGVPQGWV